MYIKITPFDTLFFRTGRPFSIGLDTWADIVFPPPPSTFYGALRSYFIFRGGTLYEFRKGIHKFKEIIGEVVENGENDQKAKYGNLGLKGIFLYKDSVPYFPLPLDIVEIKRDKKLDLLCFDKKSTLFISNYSLEHYLIWQKKEQVEEAYGWIEINDFKEYLKNEKEQYKPHKDSEFFIKEEKVGIARSRTTFTSKEGYLYRIPLIRMRQNTVFLVEVEGIEGDLLPNSDVIQLGGENKVAKFEVLSEDPLKELKNLDFDFSNGFFKLYLATPAVFKNGWIPEWIKLDDFISEYKGVKLKLVACALGRPISISGWDLVKKEPKPLRKAVPAGSVYYFKILGNSVDSEKIKGIFHFQDISDRFNDIDYPKEGFGLAILGEVRLCERS